MSDIYEQLSAERKQATMDGLIPEWFTTWSYKVFKDNYEYEANGYFGQIKRISKSLARWPKGPIPQDNPYGQAIRMNYGETWEEAFFTAKALGHLISSTPALANEGTNRGSSVSCSGSYIEDSIGGFAEARKEMFLLSQEGFGTSSYLGDIRPRGSSISRGGKAEGSLPVLEDFIEGAKKVSQGGVRRGSWAGYLPVDHADFDEWVDFLHKNPKGKNIGWIFSDEVINKLNQQDPEMLRRWKKLMHTRHMTGKGYFWKTDTVHRAQPQMYHDLGLRNKASNLCTEIVGHADEDHTYTCVLSSLNCLHYDTWKYTGLVFLATVYLDCLCESFIQRGRTIPGLEKAVRFTEKSRMLGLGLLGYHSYLQSKNMAFEGLPAHTANLDIFSHLHDESLAASQWMAEAWGEPEWCKGYGVRNTHRTAIAPNLSSSDIAGQVSQGIEPWFANVFSKDTTSGEMLRINPQFLEVMKKKGIYNKKIIRSIIDNEGSVQHLEELTDHEKLVFKTLFEIDQEVILRQASLRQKKICQSQSLNLGFSSEASEEYVSHIHKLALLDKEIKGLYYLRTGAGIQASSGECVACVN